MEKVPEIWISGTIFSRKPEISGTLFRKIVSESFRNEVPKLYQSLLNLCKDKSFHLEKTSK